MLAGDIHASTAGLDWARKNFRDSPIIYVAGNHRETVKWLENRLSEPFEGHTVVVTHHLPHERCIDKKYAGSDLNPAFASHLPDLVRSPVDLWIHGHTHEPVDFITEGTRVVCNPRGYAGYELNPGFDPCKVIALGGFIK